MVKKYKEAINQSFLLSELANKLNISIEEVRKIVKIESTGRAQNIEQDDHVRQLHELT